MSAEPAVAPVLSTPDDHIFEAAANLPAASPSTLSPDALRTTYEIARTAAEIRQGGWTRVALQFPDHMLVDAPRVVEALLAEMMREVNDTDSTAAPRIHILADTSYSACCVDEVAAEHADAQVVVHYGRTCLSPTSRLPVVYVYTSRELDHNATVEAFVAEFADKETRVVLMADLCFQNHVDPLVARLRAVGYTNVVGTEVLRDPANVIPNRRISGPALDAETTRTYSLFHIADPPQSLLLALQSRFAGLHVLSVPSTTSTTSSSPTLENPTLRTAGLLRRRFARVLTLASAGVIGILVNTLSVANYLSSIDALRDSIARAGKKSYTVVVGKLNPAKLANFAEVEGWVVVGCWESGLIEDDAGYWRPVVTPFELEVALMSEHERTWGGDWWGGIEKLKLQPAEASEQDSESKAALESVIHDDALETAPDDEVDGDVEGDESMPPEFDLRTGRLVSHSRPMRLTVRSAPSASAVTTDSNDTPSDPDAQPQSQTQTQTLAKRTVAGQLASVRGVASPGAEFLRSKRTWQGLGSDFADQAGAGETSAVVEEGRSGIARGYRVGDDETKT